MFRESFFFKYACFFANEVLNVSPGVVRVTSAGRKMDRILPFQAALREIKKEVRKIGKDRLNI